MYGIKNEHQANFIDSTCRKFLLTLALVGFSSTNVVAADETNLVEPTDWSQLVTEYRATNLYNFAKNQSSREIFHGKSLVIGPRQVNSGFDVAAGEPHSDVTERLALQLSFADSNSRLTNSDVDRVDPESLLIGPIRVRDLTPFSLQRLDLLPSAAARAYPNRWAIEMNLSNTNTFIMSDNVREFLAQRGGRARLTQADADALLQLNDDVFYFDGSIGVLTTTAHYSFNEEIAAYVTVPLQFQHGGFLDSTIESFHDAASFDDQGRPLAERGQFQGLVGVGNDKISFLDDGKSVSLADPTIGLRYRGIKVAEWDVVLEGALKVPLSLTDDFSSSGHPDIGVQVSFQRQLERQAFYINVATIWIGGSDDFTNSFRRVVPTVTFAYERIMAKKTTLIAQVTATRSSFQSSSDPDLSANKYLATIGVRRIMNGRHLTIALTENLVNYNNTPDIGLHVGYGWSF
ncbi:MAG: DUF3187 family protein [Gammaproteobacteria bacterium]